MKLQTILLCALPLVAHGKNLFTVLREQGFNRYAAELEQNPMAYQRFTSRSDVLIWAPIDQAYTDDSPANKKTLAVRQTAQQNAQIGMSACRGKPPPEPRKRQASGGEPSSNMETLITFLEDPAFVNLGPGEPARVVQDAASAPGVSNNNAIRRVKSGGGTVSNQVSGPFKYDFGMIYGVDRRFSLAGAADKTLTDSGLGSFLAAVEAAGLKDFINTQPSVTLMVPTNSDGINVREHIIQNPMALGYISEFYAKQTLQTLAGTTVKISQKNGIWLFNGVRIISSDIITKNGVIHTIEKPLTGTTATSGDSSSGTNADSGTKPSTKANKSSRPKRLRSIVNY